MSNSQTVTDEQLDDARKLGLRDGTEAAAWIIDGNTTHQTAQAIIDGYEDGDPAVMDIQPAPLSGEFAGNPTPGYVLTALGIHLDDGDDDTAIMDAYEDGFTEAFWQEVIRAAEAVIGE